MNINFERVIINNFLSIGHATLDLRDNGFVLVKGVNNNINDVALSNGSGKSTIFEAIIWCLTGETLRGSKNITNIFTKDGALVELYFNVDDNYYHILRSKDNSEYKTTFKVYQNDIDLSGKGIRDTERIYSDLLPELTSSFVGNVIILGQGMPYKFTSNTPSGRKEVLEKLSKSDFMIEDLKQRVSERKSILQTQLRENEDTLLSLRSKLEMHRSAIQDTQHKLNNLESKEVYETQLTQFRLALQDKQKEYENSTKNTELENAQICITKLKNELQTVTQRLFDETNRITDKNNKELEEINSKIADLLIQKSTLQKYISDVDNMTDICPTCHQRIEGIVKPDITNERQKFQQLELDIFDLERKRDNVASTFNKLRDSMKLDAKIKIETIQNDIDKYSSFIEEATKIKQQLNVCIMSLEKQIQEHENFIQILDVKRQSLQDVIEEGKTIENDLCTKIHEQITSGQKIESHLSVIMKFETLLKRDFRGYLLSNIISYIDTRAKSYAKDVFDTQDILFELDGNNIRISFQGKDYENLSGGEKQKVDLIVQFSIRDMLSEYMNFSSSILVLDEIFDSIDYEGCTKVINMINKRFNDVNSIYIISHHADELDIPFDNVLTITKNQEGISSITV